MINLLHNKLLKYIFSFFVNIYNYVFKSNINTAILFLVIMLYKLISLYLIEGKGFLFNDGWYYSNIARSILDGHGYSNPFGVDTGATAWVPPFLVYFILTIFYFVGDNFTSYFIIDVVQMVEISICFLFLLKAWDLTKFKKYNIILFFVFRYLILASQVHVFRMVNDLSINLMVFSLELYALLNYIYRKKGLGWLIFLSLWIPISSPMLIPGFVVVLVLVYVSVLCKKLNFPKLAIFPCLHNYKHWPFFLLAFVFLIPISLWGFRNYSVFHKFIITKSNSGFEFYLCNVKDYDGILSSSTLTMFHPDCNQDIYGADIKRQGEVQWLKGFEIISQNYLKEHPKLYIKKVFTRLENIYLFNHYDNDDISTKIFDSISANKLIIMDNLDLLHRHRWVCLDNDEANVISRLKLVFDGGYIPYYDNWKKSRDIILKIKYSYHHIIQGFLITFIPFLCILWFLLFFRKKEGIFVYTISIIYILYTVPYIFISHQNRYQEPLLALQALLISIVASLIFYRLCVLLKNKGLLNNNL